MKIMQSTKGMAAASCSYFLWGLLPIYWKSLQQLPAYEILCHRMVWSLVAMILVMIVSRRLKRLLPLLKDKTVVRTFVSTSGLLGINWLIYIWAVNSGFIVEASLGYYINPLITVVFAVVFMKERLRAGQVVAIVFAACGVAYLTFVYGRFPWISLALAMTFAVYGLLHKKTRVAAAEGLCLETMVFFLPAVCFLWWIDLRGTGSFGHAGLLPTVLMIGAGVVTTVPLLSFAYASQNIPLSLLGILQYIAPTINLFLGIFLYHEEFPHARMVGFFLVWGALAIYLAEGAVFRTRTRRTTMQSSRKAP